MSNQLLKHKRDNIMHKGKYVTILMFAVTCGFVVASYKCFAKEDVAGNEVGVYANKIVDLPDWLRDKDNLSETISFSSNRIWLSIAFLMMFLLVGFGIYRWSVGRGGQLDMVNIKLLSRFYLSPKISLVVVEVDGQRFLLGVGENVTMLTELTGRAFRQLVINEVNNSGEEIEKEAQNFSQEEMKQFIDGLSTKISELKRSIKRYKGES